MSAVIATSISNLVLGVTDDELFVVEFTYNGENYGFAIPLESAEDILLSAGKVIDEFKKGMN